MQPLNVLVWAVYPPSAGWRGEGITQTVENILLNGPEEILYTLIISSEHLSIANETLGNLKNVRVVPYGLNLRRLKIWHDIKALLRAAAPPEGLPAKFERAVDAIFDAALHLAWIVTLPFAKYWVSKEIRSANVIYNPSPVYALLSHRKKPKVFNFWDPFGFEYSAFGKSRKVELHKFMYRFHVKATAMITQSNANRQYLEQVWGINPNSISVIYNGSPDYSQLLESHVEKIGEPITRSNLIKAWPKRLVCGKTKQEALDVLLSDTLNLSVLFRLFKRLSPSTIVIMVSTQYRPYKGFEALFNVLDKLIQAAPEFDFRFVITAELPEKIRDRFNGKYDWETERVYELTRLTNLQHACLYKICNLVLHPSFAEGGPTMYPASEAASVGIPSLTNIGRHTIEMIERDGDSLSCVVEDFLCKENTVKSVLKILRCNETRELNIKAVQSARIHWSHIGSEYGKLFSQFRYS